MSKVSTKIVLSSVLALSLVGSGGAAWAQAAGATQEPGASPSGAAGLPATTPVDAPIPSAYLTGSARAADTDIQALLNTPAIFLANRSAGGVVFTNLVQKIAGSDNRAPVAAIALAGNSGVTPAQIASIGAGLAQAAKAGETSAPEYAAYIARLVAESPFQALKDAYAAALAEQATAALGAVAATGGGGPVGGGAGPTGGGTLTGGGSAGSSGTAGGSSTTSQAGGIGSGSGGGGSASFTSGTDGGTTTENVNVSPRA